MVLPLTRSIALLYMCRMRRRTQAHVMHQPKEVRSMPACRDMKKATSIIARLRLELTSQKSAWTAQTLKRLRMRAVHLCLL